jgi:aminomethyltransferase
MLTLRRTRLYSHHQDLAAQWTSFAGWDVPLQYQRVALEHQAVRRNAGLFDISHMGIMHIAEATLAKLDAALPIQASTLQAGKAAYSLILTEHGTIIDDVMLYRVPADTTFSAAGSAGGVVMVANAANTQAVQAWLENVIDDKPVCLDLDLLALQGPAFQQVVDNPQTLPSRYHMGVMTIIDGLPPVWAARTGYTGEDGVELFCLDAALYWPTLIKRLTAIGGLPCGFAARDTLRLEAALLLYGHELDLNTTPTEAGLSWAMRKPDGFWNQHGLNGPAAKRLVHLRLDKPPIPRQGNRLLSPSGDDVGYITSGCLSPTLGYPIAMGYITQTVLGAYSLLDVGSTLMVDVRGKQVAAQVVPRPFYRRSTS